MKNVIKKFNIILILSIITVCAITGYYIYYLPSNFYVKNNETLKLSSPFNIKAVSNNKHSEASNSFSTPLGKTTTLKLFGVIPIKDVSIIKTQTQKVVPSGNPFGIKIITKGVMVVGFSEVTSNDGCCSPAEQCGIKKGDIIFAINGKKVKSKNDISETISQSKGKYIEVDIKRKQKIMKVRFKPVYSLSECSYKAGMWLRDSTAGIGTITYFEPGTHVFGGLGHPICDVDTGSILPIQKGEVISVNIDGITKGISGTPGELIGSFVSTTAIGDLLINNTSGVFGKLESNPSNRMPVEVAYKQEIKSGPAKIYTTLKGDTPKEYDIEILKISYNNKLDKNMIIKVTDQNLIKESGGIVQGMSGSPIIQNGKIVGAVTHVFVNDPTKGYGIFIENMLEAGEKVERMSMRKAS